MNDHYKHGIQPLEVMNSTFSEDELRGFYKGSILKYVMRYQYKGHVQDLTKAQDYLQMLITLELKIQTANDMGLSSYKALPDED